MSRIRNHFDRELILLFVLSAFALAPLLSPGYFFDAHDADHSVFFLVEFDAAIRDGALWPRWGPDHALGYGYPLWLLYAPLAYYVAEGFHLLGLGFTAAVKATWIVFTLLGGWGMALLMRRWFGRGPAGRAAALIGGLAYVYAPYHLLNLYVRAALAEYAALAWFPWVVLAFDAVVSPSPRPSPKGRGGTLSPHAAQSPSQGEGEAPLRWPSPAEGEGGGRGRVVAVAAVAYAGLLLTHTATILIFTPLLLAYVLFALLQRGARLGWPWSDLGRTALRAAASGLLAVGLAAIFLLPMLLERRFIVQEQWVQGSYGYQQHFVYPNQWLDPFWGYGYSDDPSGPNDGMSFQLGIVTVGLALLAAVVGLRRNAIQRGITAFFLAATLATLFLSLPIARPLWDVLPAVALIQFPWRLLGITSLGLAILAGSGIANILQQDSTVMSSGVAHPQQLSAYVLALIIVLASLPFTIPQYTDIQPIDESPASIIRFETEYPDMVGVTSLAQAIPKDSPLVAQYLAGQPLDKATLLAGQGTVRTARVGGASVVAEVNLTTPGSVLFLTYDFPGWRATIDGRPAAHRTHPPYGLIVVDVPAGRHTVVIRHGATPIRTVGALVSAASLLVVGLLFWAKRPRTRSSKRP